VLNYTADEGRNPDEGRNIMTTREYRKAQFKPLTKNPSIYFPSIQIISPDNGKTNYMDITRTELRKIKKILTA